MMAVTAAARKAANAKGMATKKGGKGVVRAAVTVMLMTAGSVLSDKLADAAAEQVRIAHEEFAVEEQRIGKAIEKPMRVPIALAFRSAMPRPLKRLQKKRPRSRGS